MDIPTNQNWVKNDVDAWLPIAKQITVLRKDSPHNIAVMLAAFSEGSRRVLSNIPEDHFVSPSLVIDQNDDPRVAVAAHEWEKSTGVVSERIVISGRHLRYQSWFSLDEGLDIRHPNGIANYVGKRINRYVLVGAEEMDHAHFQWSKGYQPLPESNLLLRQDAYDSSPLELRSLETRLQIAIELQMDQKTINVIRDRIEAANRFMTKDTNS